MIEWGAAPSMSTRGRMCATLQAASEPLTRPEAAVEQEQRLLRQLGNVERATAAEAVFLPEHREIVDGIKQAALKTVVGHDESQVDLAMVEAVRPAYAPILHEMHLDSRVTEAILA